MLKLTPPKIHFFLTGGTIDSRYDGIKDTVTTNKESVIPEYIKSLKLYCRSEFTTICMKDSRALNRSDLKKILSTIEKSKLKHFIITHGTYTMSDTARYLAGNLKRKDVKIILTGSMIPMYSMTAGTASPDAWHRGRIVSTSNSSNS